MTIIYKRLCPICNEEIVYKHYSNLYLANKKGSACVVCGNKKKIGRKRIFTEDHKNNLSISHKNSEKFQSVMKSDEYRNKISIANKNHFVSDDTKSKISNSNKGKPTSYETKNKISKSLKKYYVDNPNYIEIIKKRFYDRFIDKLTSENISFLSNINDYDASKRIYYNFICNICNTEFYSDTFGGKTPKCPECTPKIKSKIQQEIYEILIEKTKKNIIQNCRTILDNKYELDFYFPDYKLAIEYNSIYWHSELNGKDKRYHLNKTLECEKKGIQLIHIFEDEWLNKKDIIINKILYMISKTKSIYARQCTIINIDSAVCNSFLEKNHIQGKISSSIRYGAYYKNELVAVMTFGKLRLPMGNKINNNNEYEMTRYSVSKSCVGIASKILHRFIKEYSPDKIISYADYRWSKGNLYNVIGFKYMKLTQPNYWYTNDYKNRIYRFNFRKNVLKDKLDVFNPDLTEWQNMQLNGYDRIWDCGNLKYELNLKENK